jgi:polyhydroxybutyrate depolymerase
VSRVRLLVITAVAIAFAVGCASSANTTSSGVATTEAPPARSSPGCAQPDEAFAHVGDNGTLTYKGTERRFSLEVPAGVPLDQPLPLVVNMHGALMTTSVLEQTSRMAERGRAQGFTVVEPQALAGNDRPIWQLAESGPDVGYVEQLVDELQQRLCIDTNRVYLAGFSMGGMMSMVLACSHPERYAAIATVAGAISVEDCRRDVAVPLLAFQGTADGVVRLDGSFKPPVDQLVGQSAGPTREAIVQSWASTNGCDVPSTDTTIPPDVDHQTYTCPPDGSVEMYIIDGGGHTWPGSPGPDLLALGEHKTQTVDATELIWSFFQQHARPG